MAVERIHFSGLADSELLLSRDNQKCLIYIKRDISTVIFSGYIILFSIDYQARKVKYEDINKSQLGVQGLATMYIRDLMEGGIILSLGMQSEESGYISF